MAGACFLLLSDPASGQERKNSYELASQYREMISQSTAYYKAAGLAAACGVKDYNWTLDVQRKIQAAQQQHVGELAAIADDRRKFESMALLLLGEQIDAMLQFDRSLAQYGAPQSLCLDLRNSQAIDRLDKMLAPR